MRRFLSAHVRLMIRGLPSKDFPRFSKFLRLPIELQNMIWEYVFHDSAGSRDRMRIGYNLLSTSTPLTTEDKIILEAPAVFSVSRQSRREAIRLARKNPYVYAKPWPLDCCLVFDIGTHFLEMHHLPYGWWGTLPTPHRCEDCQKLLQHISTSWDTPQFRRMSSPRAYAPWWLDTLSELATDCFIHPRSDPPWTTSKGLMKKFIPTYVWSRLRSLGIMKA